LLKRKLFLIKFGFLLPKFVLISLLGQNIQPQDLHAAGQGAGSSGSVPGCSSALSCWWCAGPLWPGALSSAFGGHSAPGSRPPKAELAGRGHGACDFRPQGRPSAHAGRAGWQGRQQWHGASSSAAAAAARTDHVAYYDGYKERVAGLVGKTEISYVESLFKKAKQYTGKNPEKRDDKANPMRNLLKIKDGIWFLNQSSVSGELKQKMEAISGIFNLEDNKNLLQGIKRSRLWKSFRSHANPRGLSPDAAKEFRANICKENQGIINDGGYNFGDDANPFTVHILHRPKFEIMTPDLVRGRASLREEPTTKITTINEDSVSAALRLQRETGKKTAVLNFANDQDVGGGYARGASAQEEDLCRRMPTLHYSLLASYCRQYCPGFEKLDTYSKMTEWYITHKRQEKAQSKGHVKGMGKGRSDGHVAGHKKYIPMEGCIYSEELVLRKPAEEGYALKAHPEVLGVFSAAALKNIGVERGLVPDSVINPALKDPAEYERVMAAKLRTVLHGAIGKEYKNIVLGAFGCGAFKNPAERVVKIFGGLLTEGGIRGQFENVVFAVKFEDESKSETFRLFQGLEVLNAAPGA